MTRFGATQIAPIFLRVALGVTFIWAGLGKIEGRMRVNGESAATLANMGLSAVRQAATQSADAPTPDPSGVESIDNMTFGPEGAGIHPVVNDPVAGAQFGTSESDPGASQVTQPPRAEEAPQPTVLPTDQPSAPGIEPVPAGAARQTASVVTVFSAKDFPDDVEVKRVYALAILLDRSAHVPPRSDGAASRALWPKRLARGSWPLFLAWSVAIAELLGGVFVLAGLLTRWGAVALALVMFGAIWLTEIGPAMASGETMLGFLPKRDWLATEQWRSLLWQCSLLASAVSLGFLGSGALGLDRKLFPPPPPAPTRIKPMV